MVGVQLLSQLRSRLELMLSLPSGNPYVGSTDELNDINLAYQETAYVYDWPSLLARAGIVKVANLDRYALPTNYRKFRTIKVDDVTYNETELEFLRKTFRSYTIDQIQDDILLSIVPSAASVAFTIQGNVSTGNAVTITLDTVSGLSALEEVYIKSAAGTSEFTMVSSITSPTIVARLFAAKSTNDVIYRQKDIIDLLYYRRVTLLAVAGDTTLLPPTLDFIMLYKAAAFAYNRIEQFDEAKKNDDIWKAEVAEQMLAFKKNSTGQATQFSV